MFLCVTLSVCRGSHGRSKGLSTEAIKQCVCWNNVFDLALGQQQVLGGPAWSCCSLPALICRPGTSLPFSVPFPPLFVFLLPCLCSPLPPSTLSVRLTVVSTSIRSSHSLSLFLSIAPLLYLLPFLPSIFLRFSFFRCPFPLPPLPV